MTTKTETQAEALARAKGGISTANYAAIAEGFAERGIYDAMPRVNVFTYNAWKALGRQVMKGQHGVKIRTWIVCQSKKTDAEGNRETYKRPKTVTVFHKSQTMKIGGPDND